MRVIVRAVLAFVLVAASTLALTIGTGATAQAATSTVRYGPFTVPGMSMQTFYVPAQKPCEGCYITHIEPTLVYADGSKANYNTGAMLHHIVMFNQSRTDLTCPSGVGGGVYNGERFFASGNERTVFDTSQWFITAYGYRVNTGDQWAFLTDLMNMSMSSQEVYVQVTWGHTTSSLRPLKPMWLDLNLCGNSEVSANSGYQDMHSDWTSTVNGNFVGMGGHTHDYGISVALENVTQRASVCTSVAGYRSGSAYFPGPGSGADSLHPASANALSSWKSDSSYNGHIEDMTKCKSLFGLGSVHKDDVLRLHTQRNGPADPATMGIMIAYLDGNSVS